MPRISHLFAHLLQVDLSALAGDEAVAGSTAGGAEEEGEGGQATTSGRGGGGGGGRPGAKRKKKDDEDENEDDDEGVQEGKVLFKGKGEKVRCGQRRTLIWELNDCFGDSFQELGCNYDIKLCYKLVSSTLSYLRAGI